VVAVFALATIGIASKPALSQTGQPLQGRGCIGKQDRIGLRRFRHAVHHRSRHPDPFEREGRARATPPPPVADAVVILRLGNLVLLEDALVRIQRIAIAIVLRCGRLILLLLDAKELVRIPVVRIGICLVIEDSPSPPRTIEVMLLILLLLRFFFHFTITR